VKVDEATVAAPVTMARATLEMQMAELPDRLDELQVLMAGIAETVQTYGDSEAAAAEVDQAHAEALATVAEADGDRHQRFWWQDVLRG
jgi:hypothetical protein